jgi:SAM-dependent methyltransferase
MPTPTTQPDSQVKATVTAADLDWWLAKVPTLEWTWAKTYADTAPHHYIVEGRTSDMTHEDFIRASRVIRRFGSPGRFYSMVNIYLTDPATNRKWWIMGNSIEDGTLINMADASVTYGDQRVPNTQPANRAVESAVVYDSIGPDYDAMWTKPTDLDENKAVRSFILGHFGAYAPKTLDIGCGTGLLLDLGITSPAIYTGVDPSQGMLNELVLKHPKVSPDQLYAAPLQDVIDRFGTGEFDLVAALFAPTSYLDPETIRRIPALSRDLVFLMNYDGVWLPDWYNGVEPATVGPARAATHALLTEGGYSGREFKIGPFEVTVIEK